MIGMRPSFLPGTEMGYPPTHMGGRPGAGHAQPSKSPASSVYSAFQRSWGSLLRGRCIESEAKAGAFKSVRKWDNLSLRIALWGVQVIASREDYKDLEDAGRNSSFTSGGWRKR